LQWNNEFLRDFILPIFVVVIIVAVEMASNEIEVYINVFDKMVHSLHKEAIEAAYNIHHSSFFYNTHKELVYF